MKKKVRGRGIKLGWILGIWLFVFTLIISVYFIGQGVANGSEDGSNEIMQRSTYYMIALILSFSTFIMTGFFSFVIFNHNKTMLDISEQNKRRSEEADIRGEEFRKLQFVSANYSVIGFLDNMLLYEQYSQYTEKTRETKNFKHYLRESGVDLNDVVQNFDDYVFLSVKIPFKLEEGKSTAAIRFSRFKFSKEGKDFRFVPCTGGMNALILHDEEDAYQVVAINLIVKKDSDFYTSQDVVPFRKIKLNLTMYSLLGVAVSGWTELYFTNPKKLEKNGANQYKINSSQFKISGVPELLQDLAEEM